MTRPFVDPAALLAGHGHRLQSGPAPDWPAHGLALTALAPYAFARRLDGVTKPRAFDTLSALARHIERNRGDRTIELVDVENLKVPGRTGLHSGVQIFTLLLDNGRDECLGYAWLGGAGRERLEPALRAAQPRYARAASPAS